MPIATGLAGLAAGWLLATHFGAQPGAGAAASGIPRSPDSLAGVARSAQAPSLDDVRRVVREELAAARAPAGGGSAAAAELAPTQAEPTPTQVAAQQRARQLIDGAISRGRWGDADVDAMQGVFHQLTPEQQAEVLQQYAMAVNQGRLVPDTDRPPF